MFLSGQFDGQEIYVMNADGSNQQRLTRNKREDEDPQWSPDGGKILFTSGDSLGVNWEIYVMNSDGSDLQLLTDNPEQDQDAEWSPDGERVVYVSTRDGYGEIYVMNADGSGRQRNLTKNPETDESPHWVP